VPRSRWVPCEGVDRAPSVCAALTGTSPLLHLSALPAACDSNCNSLVDRKGYGRMEAPHVSVRPLSPDPYMRYSTPRLSGTSALMNKDVLLRSSVSARRPKSILTLLPLRTLIGVRKQ